MEKNMKHGSLFTGIGGIDLGFEKAGIKTVWQCEIDDKASNVLKKQFHNIKNYRDVKEVKNDGTIEQIDIISGGFPCQDVSIAGKRAGLAGKRTGLWFEYQRIIDEFRPKWVVIENVPGLLSSWAGDKPPSNLQEGQEWEVTEKSDFFYIVKELDKRGYCVSWRVLDAQNFGVAQRRRRVFIVGSLGNADSAKVLFERESLRRNSKKSGETREEIASGTVSSIERNSVKAFSLDSLASNSMKSSNPNSGCNEVDTARTIDTSGGNPACNQGGIAIATYIAFAQNQREEVRDLKNKAGCLASQPGVHQQTYLAENVRQQRCDEVVRIFKNDCSPTLTKACGTGGNNVPMVGVRKLTPTECERLQGFPDLWTDGQANTNRYKQLGNAVCVNVAEWIGKRIIEVENKKSS